MPIVYKSKSEDYGRAGYDNRGGFVQSGVPVDYSKILRYERKSLRNFGDYSQAGTGVLLGFSDQRSLSGPAYAQAYDRLMTQARGSPRAQMAVNLAQSRQALSMVTTRTLQIVRAISQARRGRLVDAAEILIKGSGRHARKMTKKKIVADSWLELSFGWAPLYSDIYQACEVLQSSIPTTRIRGSGLDTFNNVNASGDFGFMRWQQMVVSSKIVRLSAELDTINPNLMLASNLGLTNPAVVAWDLVPFSFVIDWFLPVGKFLNSFDAQLGFSLRNGCGSYELKSYASLTESYSNGSSVSGFADAREYQRDGVGSFPLPNFGSRVQPLSGSIWRAATSVALVVQQLSRLHK